MFQRQQVCVSIAAVCFLLVHARRKFVDARKTHPELADVALEMFNRIYKIEDRCKDEGLSWDEITKVRQRETVPILGEFHEWMLQVQREIGFKTFLPY